MNKNFTDVDARVYKDSRRFETPGVDYGKVRVHKRTKTMLVVFVHGGMVWAGVGKQRRYAPANFIIFRIVAERKWTIKPYDELTLKEVCQFPLREG